MELRFTQQSAKKVRATRVCEICGVTFLQDWGYSIAAAWYVTGHSWITAHMCSNAQGGQHWGCTPEHAIQALMVCVQHDEHLSAVHLISLHDAQTALGHRKVSEEDTDLDDSLPDFHIIKEK